MRESALQTEAAYDHRELIATWSAFATAKRGKVVAMRA